MEILILGFLHGGDFCIFGTFGNFCTLGISVVWEFLPGGFIFGIFSIGTLIVSVECKHADHLTTTLAPPPLDIIFLLPNILMPLQLSITPVES